MRIKLFIEYKFAGGNPLLLTPLAYGLCAAGSSHPKCILTNDPEG
jgi:hypothetical protein